MKKSSKIETNNPDPYEDIIRSKKLDPYETLLQLNTIIENKKSN